MWSDYDLWSWSLAFPVSVVVMFAFIALLPYERGDRS